MTTKKKLLKLADFLEKKVKSHWFDMDTWANYGFKEKKCGTAACAAGWATVCFPRSGLTLVENEDGDDSLLEYKLDGVLYGGEDACGEFFKIDSETTVYLFLPNSYPSNLRGRRSVIKRLREVAALPKCAINNGIYD